MLCMKGLIINPKPHILTLNAVKLSTGYATYKDAYIPEIQE